MDEGEELARAPLGRETGEINKAAAWLEELDETVNSLGNRGAGMQHSCSGRHLGAGGRGQPTTLKSIQSLLWQTGAADPWARPRRSRAEVMAGKRG